VIHEHEGAFKFVRETFIDVVMIGELLQGDYETEDFESR
jgi:hypothetical protein